MMDETKKLQKEIKALSRQTQKWDRLPQPPPLPLLLSPLHLFLVWQVGRLPGPAGAGDRHDRLLAARAGTPV